MGVTEPPPLPRPGPWALLRQLRLPCDRRLSHRSRAAPRCWGLPCGGPRCGCATRAVSSGGTSGRSRFLAVMSAAVTSPSLSPGAARLVGETGAWECPLPPALVSHHRFFPLAAWQVCRGAPAPLLAHLVTAETERVACSFCRPRLSRDVHTQAHCPCFCRGTCLRTAASASAATSCERLLPRSDGPRIFFRVPRWEFLLL